MADFPNTARVVIIGGGAIGTSSLYHLANAGGEECVRGLCVYLWRCAGRRGGQGAG